MNADGHETFDPTQFVKEGPIDLAPPVHESKVIQEDFIADGLNAIFDKEQAGLEFDIDSLENSFEAM